MKLKLIKVVTFIMTCGTILAVNQFDTHGQGVNAGVLVAISSYMNTKNTVVITDTPADTTASGQMEDDTICGYTNIGIANVESSLNVREEASETSEIVGKMQSNAGCEILEEDGDWYKIQSGKVTGYVKGEYLITGDEAKTLAGEIETTIATVTTETLHVRTEANADCDILALMPEGEDLEVLEDDGEWIKVDVDGDEGYVSCEYVELSTQLPKAQTMTELKYGQGVSDVRVSLVAFATQYVGNSYVWGGTSLTNGADCSGFVMSVFANYGIYLPHSSSAQANCGTTISASDAQPGDLFFYSNGGGIHHVAIYIGNGQIVHASSPSTGIKISNAYYRTPAKVVRVLGN